MNHRLHEDVSRAETDYGAVLLDERDGRYVELNATAATVLRHLDAARRPRRDGAGDPVDAAVAELVARCDVAPERARADVRALLSKLTALGVLVP